jgi:hypothetical protein
VVHPNPAKSASVICQAALRYTFRRHEARNGRDHFRGPLHVRIMTGALDDLQLGIRNSGGQLHLMFRWKQKVVPARQD